MGDKPRRSARGRSNDVAGTGFPLRVVGVRSGPPARVHAPRPQFECDRTRTYRSRASSSFGRS